MLTKIPITSQIFFINYFHFHKMAYSYLPLIISPAESGRATTICCISDATIANSSSTTAMAQICSSERATGR